MDDRIKVLLVSRCSSGVSGRFVGNGNGEGVSNSLRDARVNGAIARPPGFDMDWVSNLRWRSSASAMSHSIWDSVHGGILFSCNINSTTYER
uniref:Uncharacterized protein n=1 Tax=Moniliophthora roreri TaxID=221103 RepID=A0A0W0GDM0_MONRR